MEIEKRIALHDARFAREDLLRRLREVMIKLRLRQNLEVEGLHQAERHRLLRSLARHQQRPQTQTFGVIEAKRQALLVEGDLG